MADMHTPLANCPFCGGENLEFYFADIDGWIAHVRCIECDDMIGPMSECKYDDKFEAAEDATIAWNHRAPSQDAETVKALREAVTKLMNEVVELGGFGPEITALIGDAKWRVLAQRVQEVRTALAGSAS